MAVEAVPSGYPQVIPYLSIDGASDAIEFYKKVFGAEEKMRMGGPDGRVGHAEIAIGNGMVMLSDAFAGMGAQDPKTIGGSPVTVSLYLEDVDAVYKKALDNGATSESEPTVQFYGDRTAAFIDPWGHRWHVATHVEDVSEEEMAKRAQEWAAQS